MSKMLNHTDYDETGYGFESNLDDEELDSIDDAMFEEDFEEEEADFEDEFDENISIRPKGRLSFDEEYEEDWSDY